MNDIDVHLERLINPDAAAKLRSAGLHKVAAALAKSEGFKIAEEMTLKDAVTILGTKLRQKNAEYSRIASGLSALENFFKE